MISGEAAAVCSATNNLIDQLPAELPLSALVAKRVRAKQQSQIQTKNLNTHTHTQQIEIPLQRFKSIEKKNSFHFSIGHAAKAKNYGSIVTPSAAAIAIVDQC